MVRAQEYWEYLDYKWDRTVIEYDLYSQVRVAEDMQETTSRMNSRMAGLLQHRVFDF